MRSHAAVAVTVGLLGCCSTLAAAQSPAPAADEQETGVPAGAPPALAPPAPADFPTDRPLVLPAPPKAPPPAPLPPVAATTPPRRAGLFHRGINIDLLELGSVQAFGAGGSATGIALGHGAELDLGSRFALRLPLRIAAAPGSTTIQGDSGAGAFVAAVLAPGIVYRFRETERQRFIPFVTAAIDLGAYSFGRHLLGLEPAPEDHGQDFARSGPAPSAGVGLLYSPVSVFALRLAVDYTYLFVAHSSLHLLSETVGIRFSF